MCIMKRSNSTISTGKSPSSNRKRLAIGQKREVIQMLKSCKSSFQFSYTLESARQLFETSNVLLQSTDNIDQAKIKMPIKNQDFRKKF